MSIRLEYLKVPVKYIQRMHFEMKHLYRNDFMRDRDRIMYSRAFRRLASKTQIYISGFDDHARNRLTHTLEVSQIARTIATNLQLDIDLTEAIALGHDLGHTVIVNKNSPFMTEKIPHPS